MSKKGIGWSVLGFLIVAGITCAITLPYHPSDCQKDERDC